MSGALLLAAITALEPGDQMHLELVGDGEVTGMLAEVGTQSLVLTGGNQRTEVPLALVEAAWVDGAPMDLPTLHREVGDLHHRQELQLAALAAHTPNPFLVVGSSLLLPGSGHLMLGERSEGWGYIAVTSIIWGTGAWLMYSENYQPLLPLAGVDLLFRTYATADAAILTRQRRTRLGLSVHQSGLGVQLYRPLGAIPEPPPGVP